MNESGIAEEASDEGLEEFGEGAGTEGLFQRNLETFLELLPSIGQQLKNHKPISELCYLDNGEPTVEFNNEYIYPRGAVTEACEQLEEYRSRATRLQINEIPPENFDVHARGAYKKFLDRIRESGLKHSPVPAHDESYFLVCFGIGLAQHLDALVERTKCWVLVLIEPNFDFFYHSCFVYDWRPLLERMQQRRGIEFMLHTDPSHTSSLMHGLFRHHNPVGLDGTTLFRHYRTGLISEIEREFSGKVLTSIMGLGFFQDEINMIGQTYKNLEHGKTRMVESISKPAGMPCMIVANGPSLDNLIPLIKENADKAVIFACGSAITILAENGIKADFWVMTERVKDVLVMVQETAERFGVRDVVFIGSSTVFPGVTDFFDDYILFFRPGLSTAPLFATRADQVLNTPDPLAANSGLSAALHMGFREFYFMGVDVGSRYQDRGHAKGGYYANRDDHIKSLGIPVPANFGGTVWTTSVLKWSKESLERLIKRMPGRMYYNLSDGALIEKAAPLHHKVAKFPKPKRPKEELVKELTAKCSIYTLEEFEDRWDEAAVMDRLPEFCDALKKVVVDDDMTDYRYLREVAQILEPGENRLALAMLVRGTVFSFLIGFEWWNNRITDPEEREVAREIFKEEYAALLDRMVARATEIFAGLENGEPWEDFIE